MSRSLPTNLGSHETSLSVLEDVHDHAEGPAAALELLGNVRDGGSGRRSRSGNVAKHSEQGFRRNRLANQFPRGLRLFLYSGVVLLQQRFIGSDSLARGFAQLDVGSDLGLDAPNIARGEYGALTFVSNHVGMNPEPDSGEGQGLDK